MKSRNSRPRNRVLKAFGREIRKRRLLLELSQQQIADRAGLHYNYVSSVERGERNISLENIIALADALDCSPKDLMPE